MSNAMLAEKAAPNLNALAAGYLKRAAMASRRVIICAGTGCVAGGALDVHEAFVKTLEGHGISTVTHLDGVETGENAKGFDIYLSKSGCQGFCQMGPLVTIQPEGYLYTRVKAADVPEIVEKTLLRGELVERLLYTSPGGEKRKDKEEIPFYQRQQRTVLKACGEVDPDDILEYVAQDGYAMAEKAYTAMSPEEVCAEILASGLRGRGGGGFPTGRKWELTRVQKADKKYVVCNGDEGDPGAFMDRSVMEGNPHSVIEGMLIAARAIGADEGYVYVRMEYPLAVRRLRRAVTDAEELGVLGTGLFGTDAAFHIHIMEGAGAFVCGEETALIASVQGRRGMPMPKPPFPAQKGLWDRPYRHQQRRDACRCTASPPYGARRL